MQLIRRFSPSFFLFLVRSDGCLVESVRPTDRMLVFEFLTVQPVAFFNGTVLAWLIYTYRTPPTVIVHTNLVFVCIALSLLVSIITCARERKKEAQRTTNESHPSQPISNTDTASKKTTAAARTSSTTPNGTKKTTPLPPQPNSGPCKDANCDEEKGVRKKHKREETEKKDENRGSVRISIYGAAASSSEADDEIYMQDIFDDVTAKDDPFPGEAAEANNKRKGRKKKTGASLQSTQHETVHVETTQASSDQPTSTVDPTIEGTKEPTHTIDQTRDTTIDQTKDPSKADATTSERPGARIPSKQTSVPRQSDSRNKDIGGGRKKKSAFKYDPSKTGETATESTKKRIPKNRKKVSACTKARTRSSDAPSFTQKD
ncbi:hypothetical protein PRIPAC_74581 [Pristionchus pacificus]|uniref:Uncharacterized protein n=1 Tax=Pristionchus pacificus TaxID=54126 RepID=A0A2A6C6Z8_PRIPA|nr:hypothetical protein PRIPAC_74581 [Pristionchus pacificus]|eukprot:PDM73982.1 hypothetical protein PRIPAC_41338 [Pristionchus pacificus]